MEQTFYYQFPNGAVSVQTIRSDAGVIDPPEVPAGAVEIEAEVYAVLLAEIDRGTGRLIATLRAADQARALVDYTALRAAGIPAATAARLSDYQGSIGPVGLPPLVAPVLSGRDEPEPRAAASRRGKGRGERADTSADDPDTGPDTVPDTALDTVP